MPVLLGNDGFSNDMFVEMKTAYLLHKAWRNDPRAMPGDPDRAYSSMGNYIFNRDVLEEVLTEDIKKDSAHDFGKSILPGILERCRVFAYNFRTAPLPGQKEYEEPGYWRDVGNIEAYWSAHMDLLGEKPRFDLNNDDWPIMAGRYNGPPSRILGRQVEDSILSEGVVINGAFVRHSIIGRGVVIEPGAVVRGSVLLDGAVVEAGAVIENAVLDSGVRVGEKAVIGADIGRRCPRDQDIVLVGMDTSIGDGVVIEPGSRLEPGTRA